MAGCVLVPLTCRSSCPRFYRWHKFLPATWPVCILVYFASLTLCVDVTWKEFALHSRVQGDLSEETLLLIHAAFWLMQYVFCKWAEREAEHNWHLWKRDIMLLICERSAYQLLTISTTHSLAVNPLEACERNVFHQHFAQAVCGNSGKLFIVHAIFLIILSC